MNSANAEQLTPIEVGNLFSNLGTTRSILPTLEDVFKTYCQAKKLRRGTVNCYKKSLNVVQSWRSRRMDEITSDDVLEMMEHTTRSRGPASANKTFRLLRALFNFALHYYEKADGEPLMKRNPVNKISDLRLWNKLQRRQSIILQHQIPQWFRAVLYIDYASTRDMVLFMWLTGCRVGDARKLTWSDVDLSGGIITFRAENTKNGTTCHIPISKFICEMLKQRKAQRPEQSPWVFWNKRDPQKQLSNNYKAYRNACQRLGFQWKFHDLRRGFITRAVALGLSDIVIKRLVNHSHSSNVTAGYAVLDPEDLRWATERITKSFLELANYQMNPVSIVRDKGNCIGEGLRMTGTSVTISVAGDA